MDYQELWAELLTGIIRQRDAYDTQLPLQDTEEEFHYMCGKHDGVEEVLRYMRTLAGEK